MLAAANIPLSKTDHPTVRESLHKRVVNGGCIPKAKQLQDCYLSRETSARVDEVKTIVKDKPVSIITDEMSDANGRFVLNVLAAPLELKDGAIKSYLLDTIFLEATNHSTVAAAVVKTITTFEIDYDNVIVINTDNASYMRKAYSAVWKGLFRNSIPVTCLAHITNLLGDAFKKPFKSVNQFVKNINAMFWNAGARKSRYLCYVKSIKPGETPTMPPNPIGTRWNGWYDSVDYHLKHLELYEDFVREEMEHAKSLAPNSLKDVDELIKYKQAVALLKAQMHRSAIFVSATDFFQSQSAMAMNVWSTLLDLQDTFMGGGVTLLMAERYFTKDFSGRDKTLLLDLYNQAYSLVAEKMQKYMSIEGQPGIKFLHDCQFFNPSRLIFLSSDVDSMTGIPALGDVLASEIRKYTATLAPAAVKNAPASGLDCDLFWKSCANDVPVLSGLATRYMFATVNSADEERSFSLYNLIHSERRRSLGQDTIRQLLFLYQGCQPIRFSVF